MNNNILKCKKDDSFKLSHKLQNLILPTLTFNPNKTINTKAYQLVKDYYESYMENGPLHLFLSFIINILPQDVIIIVVSYYTTFALEFDCMKLSNTDIIDTLHLSQLFHRARIC